MGGRQPDGERFMLLGPSRVLYAGLLGTPTVRSLGGAAVYVALSGAVEVEVEGCPVRRGPIAIVPPYQPHRVRAEGRSIACLLVEPEAVAPAALRALLGLAEDDAAARGLAGRVREACAAGTAVCGSEFTPSEFDAVLFGRPLADRRLDSRISAVAARFQVAPARPLSGDACARATGLSLSRFLHLFKSETGVTFKTFRAWKRARTVLDHANRDTNLTYLALDIGYPDSTHFSHSVRRIYGLQPSAILSGSRRLRIVRSGPSTAAAGLAAAFGS